MTAGAPASTRTPFGAALARLGPAPWVIPLALFVAALVAYLRTIDATRLWYDEVASIRVPERGPGFFLTDRFGWMNVQTPLHYLITWLMLQLGDPAETSFWVRLPSALAAAGLAPLVYLFGRDLLRSRAAGLVAAVLLIFAPVSAAYASDARPYTMLAFWATAAAYCLGRATFPTTHTGRGTWWAGFAGCTLVGVYSSYNTLTLALPALAPYLAWVLVADFLGGSRRRNALYGATALVVIALGSVPALLDVFRVPRIPPNLAAWNPAGAVFAMPELSTWFAALGYGGLETRYVQPLLFLAALVGVLLVLFRMYRARRSPGDGPARVTEARAVAILASLAWLPAVILSVLGTTNVVYQRYAMFAMPAYFLLIAYGLVCWPRSLRERPEARRSLANAAGGVALAIAMVYAVAALFGQGPLLRLDYRAVARYLSENARPADTAVFLGTDQSVADVYWHGNRPLTTISALDPRIATLQPAADVYWLIGYEHPAPTDGMPSTWQYLGDYAGLSLYREPHGSGAVDIVGGVQVAAKRLREAGLSEPVLAQVGRSLLATARQAAGDTAAAARTYREAGTLYPIGGEYEVTSREFGRRGEWDSAWLDAIMSKSMQPERPSLHRWLAELLDHDGLPALAEQERAVARFLEELP
jgi:hypothetical protein